MVAEHKQEILVNKDYYEGLDGIRAIAVISVMLFHFYPQGVLRIGWAGVDLFFVLSGFLITNILIKYKNRENYFKSFYMRRVVRIFPIYYLVIIPLVLLNYFALQNRAIWEQISYFFYLQNFAALGSEFLFGLEHTWSLAIEEQFYLFFPFVIRFLPLKKSFYLVIGLILSAILLRTFFAINNPEVFYWQSVLFFTRMDSLLLGALLPLAVTNFSISKRLMSRILNVSLLIGFVFIFLSIINYSFTNLQEQGFIELLKQSYGKESLSTPYGHLRFTFFAIFFAAWVGKVAYFTDPIRKMSFLRWRPLEFIGRISYGIYLYHWIIQRFITVYLEKTNWEINAFVLICIKITLTIFIAYISWILIEKPILKLKDRYKY